MTIVTLIAMSLFRGGTSPMGPTVCADRKGSFFILSKVPLRVGKSQSSPTKGRKIPILI